VAWLTIAGSKLVEQIGGAVAVVVVGEATLTGGEISQHDPMSSAAPT
jgi:hypothetical protein